MLSVFQRSHAHPPWLLKKGRQKNAPGPQWFFFPVGSPLVNSTCCGDADGNICWSFLNPVVLFNVWPFKKSRMIMTGDKCCNAGAAFRDAFFGALCREIWRQAHFTQRIQHASGLYKDIRMAQIGNVLSGFWVFSHHRYLHLCGAVGELSFLHLWLNQDLFKKPPRPSKGLKFQPKKGLFLFLVVKNEGHKFSHPHRNSGHKITTQLLLPHGLSCLIRSNSSKLPFDLLVGVAFPSKAAPTPDSAHQNADSAAWMPGVQVACGGFLEPQEMHRKQLNCKYNMKYNNTVVGRNPAPPGMVKTLYYKYL